MYHAYETIRSDDPTHCKMYGPVGPLFQKGTEQSSIRKKSHNIALILADLWVVRIGTGGDSCAILTKSERTRFPSSSPKKTVTRAIYRHCIAVSRGILS